MLGKAFNSCVLNPYSEDKLDKLDTSRSTFQRAFGKNYPRTPLLQARKPERLRILTSFGNLFLEVAKWQDFKKTVK